MSAQDDDYQGVLWPVLFGILLLIIGLVLGVAIWRTSKVAAPVTSVAVVASAAAPASGLAVEVDEAAVRVEDGIVKFYFVSGKADLATGAQEALGDVVMGVAAGKRAIISGYHDVTGDMAQNEALAKLRAEAVRDTLVALGIGEDKMELRKPDTTAATGSNAEARRVEVTLE
ncbi:OmpA family protein [Ottowia sp.]|uniref:OmpA family protein n=1 Tax=Ottowia sp. TaxID=1898956 RepID=UPI003A886AA8